MPPRVYAPRMTFLGALLLASALASDIENPRIVSPNGEYVVVVRQYPQLGDFDRISVEDYYRRDPVDEWLDEVPLPEPEVAAEPQKPEPVRAAIYRVWPGNYRELLGEFAFDEDERSRRVLVSDDGFIVTYGAMRCNASGALLSIRSRHGNVVRKVPVLDAMTRRDQQWLCRGGEEAVRFTLAEHRRLTMHVADGQCKGDDLEIDLETGNVAAPASDRCPAALLITPKAEDAGGQWMLDQERTRVPVEYPEVATKARITGLVTARVVAGRDGRVESVTIVKPLPFGMDQAVKTAILQWQFSLNEWPATGVITFRFEIVRHYPIVTTTCHGGTAVSRSGE